MIRGTKEELSRIEKIRRDNFMEKTKKKIQIWATPKQYQFLKFLNDNFQFGKLEIIIHNSDPQEVLIKEIRKPFDGKIKQPLDNRL